MGMKINGTLPGPNEIKNEYPMTSELNELKNNRDNEIKAAISGK